MSASAGAGTALAAAGDLVVVDPPAPVLPDDSATPLEAAISGNGRYVAVTESRENTSLAPQYDYNFSIYGEQHIWRYDTLTGARVKVDKGGNPLGGARQPVLSENGGVAAWTDFAFFADADYSTVYRSKPDTGAAGQVTIAGGSRGPDSYYPEFIRTPSLSADGTKVGLSSSPYGGCYDVPYVWNSPEALPAGQPTVLQLATGCQGDAPAPGPQVGDRGSAVKLSEDGKLAFFAGGDAFYVYDLVNRAVRSLPLPLAGDDFAVYNYALAADGKTATFVTKAALHPDGYAIGSVLWSLDIATGASTRIATIPDGDATVRTPAISANGRYIAFDWPQHPVTGADAGHHRIYQFDRTTGAFRRVSQSSTGAPIDVVEYAPVGTSSDGRYVTFLAANAKQAVPDDATPTGPHAIRADVLGPVGDATAPPAPASIKVSQGSVGAQLTWPAVTDPSGPVTYRIRQRPIAGATHSLIGTKVQSTTSLTLKGLVAGQPYRFAVQAEDAQGNRAPATTVAFTAAGTADPTPPTITAPAKPYVGTSEQQLTGPFTINGSDLANVTAVLIGNQPATGLTITGTKITGTAPRSGDAASLPVTVIGPFGAKAAGRYYYRQQGTTETGD